MHGPPAYFTPNWETAWESIKKLEALRPSVVITGHGQPMGGDLLKGELEFLARDFHSLAPDQGFYVNHPIPADAPPPSP